MKLGHLEPYLADVAANLPAAFRPHLATDLQAQLPSAAFPFRAFRLRQAFQASRHREVA